MQVKVVAITEPLVRGAEGEPLTPEQFVVYTARVSSPANQLNTETAPRLLAYCIRHRHWSIFEQVDMTVEITTSRAIAAQILRHRSFCFQEFSLRYAAASGAEDVQLRLKGATNRQGSLDEVAGPDLAQVARDSVAASFTAYRRLMDAGVAPESARFVLPLCTQTRIYMKGSLRSWIHYFAVRCDSHAQKEHQEVALAICRLFGEHFPMIAEALATKPTSES